MTDQSAELTDEQIDAELKAAGIDMEPAYRKLRSMVDKARAAELAKLREQCDLLEQENRQLLANIGAGDTAIRALEYENSIREENESKLREQVAHQTACIDAQSETCARYAKRLDEAFETAKDIYRTIHPGGCRMLSVGHNCSCFLCLIDEARNAANHDAEQK